jgi:hypothetical protein
MRLSRRTALVATACVVAALVIVFVGRRERATERRTNLDGIAYLRALVGSNVDNADDYRVGGGLYCLLYDEGGRVFGVELCVDQYGRLVEAVDRRGSQPAFYTVTAEPSVAPLRLDLGVVSRSINRIQAAANAS